MTALTVTAGYPVHAVARYHVQPNGVITYRAACGRRDYTTSTLGTAGSARRMELCARCFPGHWNGYVGPMNPTRVDDLTEV